MIRINLIPPEVFEGERKRKLILLGSVVGALILLVFVGYWWGLNAKVANKRQRLVEVEEELKKLQIVEKQVNSYKARVKKLEKRLEAILQLTGGRLLYPDFFQEYLTVLPADVWILSMNSTTQNRGRLQVTTQCQSNSSDGIASLVLNLEKSSYFGNVKLKTITATKSTLGADTFSFSITFDYTSQT